jgi:hypothetical protein
MMGRKKIKVGDIFEIPLSNDRKAVGQFVYDDKRVGPIVQIFDYFVEISQDIEIGQLEKSKLLFPPVVVGLLAAIRSGSWSIIGNMPPINFSYPKFLSFWSNIEPGSVNMWFLWDGKQYTRLGKKLPKEFRNLELVGAWSPNDLSRRIETGENPFGNMPRRD